MISHMGEKDSLEMLRSATLGRLGCNIDGAPYVVPINFIFDGKFIYVHSLPGLKINALRKNPRACIQIDEIKDEYHWRSVIAYGNYEEIEDEEQKERMLAEMFKRLPHLTPVESRMSRMPVQSIVFRLLIDKVTGVCEKW